MAGLLWVSVLLKATGSCYGLVENLVGLGKCFGAFAVFCMADFKGLIDIWWIPEGVL